MNQIKSSLWDNSDYQELLKAVAVLEAQRARAIKDLDELQALKEKALADPFGFVERLQRGEKIYVPGPQSIYPIPAIDFSKYSVDISLSSVSPQPLTRLSTRASRDLSKNDAKEKPHQQQKSNKYWTVEEQKQLEQLLLKFPPEKIESCRWRKISKCLGNRTPMQVASRVQKYFIKLLKAGMPIPGRMPNMAYLKKPKRTVLRSEPSTFLVSQALPVYIPEEDDGPLTSLENAMDSEERMSNDEDFDFDPELRETPEYKELILLKKILREKQQSCGLR